MNISVIIPTHNVEGWIDEALASVQGQTTQPYEVIVVDDASDDGTVRRVQAAGSGIRLIQVQCRNAAATRNRGVDEARGNVIAFLDGDDRWLPPHLERGILGLSKGDVAHFAHHDGFDNATGIFEGRQPLQKQSEQGISDEKLLSYFVGKNHGWPTSGMIIRRDRFLAVQGFDETQRRRHDAEMFLRVVHGHTWSYEPRATWEYRLARPGNISGKEAECAAYFLEAQEKIFRLYRDSRLDPLMETQARKVLSYSLKEKLADGQEHAIALALEKVSPQYRLMYRAARLVPGVAASVLSGKRRLKHGIGAK